MADNSSSDNYLDSSKYLDLERYKAIVDYSDDAIISKDLNGIIQTWNKGAKRLYGYTADEVVGKPIEILTPREREREIADIMQKIRRGEAIDHYETKRVKKNGELIDVAITVSPIKDREGKIMGASTIARDITDRLDIERRKDDFISMAAHELKTPITSIKAFTQLLQRLPEVQKGKSKVILEKTEDQINKLTKLISDLLDVSKMQAGKLIFQTEEFNIDDLVSETVEIFQQLTDTHAITLQGKTGKKVYGDKYRIEQVLNNLLTNALKYSAKADRIDVKLMESDDYVTVMVSDYGIGIPHKHQDHIFDRFYRVQDNDDRNYPGLGIGLYIASQIIIRHNGKIWLDSKEGRGSTFYFSLPKV